VKVTSKAIQPAIVPVAVTIHYRSYKPIAAVLAVVTFLAGSFVVWAAGKKAQWSAGDPAEGFSVWRHLSEFPRWIADNYAGVVGGAIAGITVFIAKFWRTPPWGAMAPEEWFALLGGVFSAYTATLTTISAAVPPRRETQPVTGGGGGPPSGDSGGSPLGGARTSGSRGFRWPRRKRREPAS
jgi:hypothetical protein